MKKGEVEYASVRSGTLIDLLLIMILAGAVFAVSAKFDLSNRIIAWMHRNVSWQLDELFPVSIYLVFAFAVFAWRRYKILQVQIRRRQQAEEDNARLIRRLADALSDVSTLRKLLPMCLTCKKIRDEEGSWYQMESYLESHLHARLDNGICPECARRYYYPGTGARPENSILT